MAVPRTVYLPEDIGLHTGPQYGDHDRVSRSATSEATRDCIFPCMNLLANSCRGTVMYFSTYKIGVISLHKCAVIKL